MQLCRGHTSELLLVHQVSTATMAATMHASTQKVACNGTKQSMVPAGMRARVARNSRLMVQARANAFMGQNLAARVGQVAGARSARTLTQVVYAVKDGAALDRPLRVAVIGGGPSGACAAETLAKGGIETYLIEVSVYPPRSHYASVTSLLIRRNMNVISKSTILLALPCRGSWTTAR